MAQFVSVVHTVRRDASTAQHCTTCIQMHILEGRKENPVQLPWPLASQSPPHRRIACHAVGRTRIVVPEDKRLVAERSKVA